MFSNENQMTTDSTLHKHTFKESLEPGRSETQWHHKTYFWPHSSTSDTGCGWRLHSIETKERKYKAERARTLLVTVLWTHLKIQQQLRMCPPQVTSAITVAHGQSWTAVLIILYCSHLNTVTSDNEDIWSVWSAFYGQNLRAERVLADVNSINLDEIFPNELWWHSTISSLTVNRSHAHRFSVVL